MTVLAKSFGGEVAVARGKGSFARGLVWALPLSLIAWLVLFWVA